MTREITKRQLQAIQSRDKIFASAVGLFQRKGFDNVTIEEICAEAGVSKGLFYNYFSSKEEIFVAEFNQVEHLFEQIRASFGPTDTCIEKLLISVERILRYVLDFGDTLGRDALRIVYINALRRPNSFLMDRDRQYFSLIAEIIQCGQQSGEIRTDISVEEIRELITTHVFGCYFVWIAAEGFDIQKEMRSHLTMIVDGIRATPRK